MRFRKGKRRFVIVIPLLEIAIKFPIIRFVWLIKNIFYLSIRMQWKTLWTEMSLPNYDFSFKSLMFQGISDNWNEFMFYRKTKHTLLQPTYFSFFGLFNIQKSGDPFSIRLADFGTRLYEITNGEIFDDIHHMTNPDNYCLCRGKFRMVDYGSKRVFNVIKKYGDKISESFSQR